MDIDFTLHTNWQIHVQQETKKINLELQFKLKWWMIVFHVYGTVKCRCGVNDKFKKMWKNRKQTV